MHHKARFPNAFFGASLRPDSAALAILLLLLFLILVLLFMTLIAQPVQAQTYKVIHNFAGGHDEATPFVGLTMDAMGNIYGTAYAGGSAGFCRFAAITCGCGRSH
jgi:hypothetical protein